MSEQIACARCQKLFQTSEEDWHNFCSNCEKELSNVETGPITVESLWKIYTEERVIPMTFKPTGETVYVTAQFCDWIERFTQVSKPVEPDKN